MKKMSINFRLNYCLLAGLLLALLALSGCESSDSSGDNAVLYYGESGARVVAVVIAEPSALDGYRAGYAPKTGHLYAISAPMVKTDEPVSMGEVSISGSTITFKPLAEFGFDSQSSFTGNMSGGSITFASIPGTPYTNFKVNEIASGRAEDLFDGDISDYIGNSGNGTNTGNTGNDSNPGNTNTGTGTSANSGYMAGKVVSYIELDSVASGPVIGFKYSNGTRYLEGFPVELSKISVTVYYDDDTKLTVTDVKQFTIDPPEYRKFVSASDTQTIRYNGDYTGIRDYNIVTPKRHDFDIRPYIPSFENILLDLTWPNKGDAENEKPLRRQTYYEDERLFSIEGPGIQAHYGDVNATTGVEVYLALPNSVLYLGEFNHNPASPELTIHIGSKEATFPVTEIYAVKNVALDTKPPFTLPILFDDPRLVNGGPDYLEHWTTRLYGGKLRVNYIGAPSRTIDLVEALTYGYPDYYMTQTGYDKPKLIVPNNLAGNPELTISYSFTTDLKIAIPVYNKLTGITIKNKSMQTILLDGAIRNPNHPAPDGDEVLFYNVRISATYQMGNDKNKTVDRDNILVYPESGTPLAELDDKHIDIVVAGLTTNLATICTTANSEAYVNREKLVKATITYTTDYAGSGFTASPQSRHDSIEIGVSGY